VFDVAEGDAIATGDEGFEHAHRGGRRRGAADAADMLAVGAAAAVAAPKKPARSASRPKPAKQGGLGQMIGVVLGGLMALPITYATLIWGFGKDPFKFTKNVPPDLAFLLPENSSPVPGLPGCRGSTAAVARRRRPGAAGAGHGGARSSRSRSNPRRSNRTMNPRTTSPRPRRGAAAR